MLSEPNNEENKFIEHITNYVNSIDPFKLSTNDYALLLKKSNKGPTCKNHVIPASYYGQWGYKNPDTSKKGSRHNICKLYNICTNESIPECAQDFAYYINIFTQLSEEVFGQIHDFVDIKATVKLGHEQLNDLHNFYVKYKGVPINYLYNCTVDNSHHYKGLTKFENIEEQTKFETDLNKALDLFQVQGPFYTAAMTIRSALYNSLDNLGVLNTIIELLELSKEPEWRYIKVQILSWMLCTRLYHLIMVNNSNFIKSNVLLLDIKKQLIRKIMLDTFDTQFSKIEHSTIIQNLIDHIKTNTVNINNSMLIATLISAYVHEHTDKQHNINVTKGYVVANFEGDHLFTTKYPINKINFLIDNSIYSFYTMAYTPTTLIIWGDNKRINEFIKHLDNKYNDVSKIMSHLFRQYKFALINISTHIIIK